MKTKLFTIVSVSIFAVILLLLMTAGDTFTVSPGPRAYHQMVYDPDSGNVILYGGQDGSATWPDPAGFRHETWFFDPIANVWTKMLDDDLPTNPSGSAGGDMTYDSKDKLSILSVMSDDLNELQTWAYDSNANIWEQLENAPRAPIVGQRIAYDSESDRIIMFGGFDITTYKLVDETWVYNFNTDTWTNMNPDNHPEARNYHGMAYDSNADRVVVWGGDLKGKANKNAIWTYDFNTNIWEKSNSKDANPPELRDYIHLVYDDELDKFLVYGGYPYGNNETWVYDLNTNMWEQMIPATNPGSISRYGMVYAKNVNAFILFGGQDGALNYQYKADTWSYNLGTNTWTNILPEP